MEDWGEDIFTEGVGIQPSTSQASNYNPRWQHRNHDLSSVPFQNNTCTAGYFHVRSDHDLPNRAGKLENSVFALQKDKNN